MNRDFATREDLYGYVGKRVFIDTHRYAVQLLSMGDVFFHPVSKGLHHPLTGECLLPFRRGFYYTDDAGRTWDINTFSDYERATSNIYTKSGAVFMPRMLMSRLRLIDGPPPLKRASDAVTSIVAKVLNENYDYVLINRAIKNINELIDFEAVMDSGWRSDIYDRVERTIAQYLSGVLEGYHWHELWLTTSKGSCSIEIKADIRIKDFYERKFDEMDRKQESDHGHLYRTFSE